MCSVKNLRDDQDELKKICGRFAGTTRPLSFLRANLNVKEFVQILDFIPDLRQQVSVVGKEHGDATFTESTEILIFFGESENVFVPHVPSSLFTTNLESLSSEFCSESESFHDKLKKIYVQKYSMMSTQDSLTSSNESYDVISATSMELLEMESESYDIECEFSNEIIDDKAPLVPEELPQEDCDSQCQIKPSKSFGKSQKILFLSAVVLATIAVGFIWKK